MKNLHTKLNVLENVLDITKKKLKANKITLDDAQYVLLIINKYLDSVHIV